MKKTQIILVIDHLISCLPTRISISDDKITFKTGVIWKERETTVTIVLNVDGVVADANQRFTFKLNPKNLRLEPSHVFLAYVDCVVARCGAWGCVWWCGGSFVVVV